MTLEEVQARRDEVWAIVRKHGVDRLTVVLPEPGQPLPHDVDVYFQAGFTPDVKARWRGAAAMDYVDALTDMSDELSALLGCRAWVGDVDGTSESEDFARSFREQATAL